MRLLASTGELVPGRCRSSNLCDYCAKLAAVETAEMLALDALENGAPEVWCVLTTPRAEADPEVFREARRQVRDAVRARWPAEFAQLVEWTTGYGPLSGGRRRPHWNLLIKGVPASDVDELRQVVVAAWCTTTTRARPQAQYVGRISETGGLMRYLALHFQKQSQQPPKGWHGHRFSTSRGYLAAPAAVMRERARASLRLRRELWKAQQRGLEGAEAESAAAIALEQAASTTWRLFFLPRSILSPPLAAAEGRTARPRAGSTASAGAPDGQPATAERCRLPARCARPCRAPAPGRGLDPWSPPGRASEARTEGRVRCAECRMLGFRAPSPSSPGGVGA